MKRPLGVPENGFYYHYKHDPSGEVNNYAYEVIGVGCHTEEEGSFMVVYRPLYESSVYLAGKLYDLRPLAKWNEPVTVGGSPTGARFWLITDPNITSALMEIRECMYPPVLLPTFYPPDFRQGYKDGMEGLRKISDTKSYLAGYANGEIRRMSGRNSRDEP